jgi:glycosyltransferase involved in cell wall biosynthesis
MIGSTDSSSKIINEFNNNYPNKIIYLKKKNGGLSDARNFGLPYASGEYIGFVDADDYVDLNMFESMYNTSCKNNLDLVECDFIWEYPNKSKIDIGKNYNTYNNFFYYGRVMAWNKLFKSNIIKNHNLNFSVGLRYEDIDFFYKYISYVNKFELINKPFYHYMQRDNSIINKQNEKNNDIFFILNNIIDFYKANNLYEKNIDNLEYIYIRFLLGSSFLRIVKIKNKNIRKILLNKTINELYIKFPNWKKNKLLNKNKTFKNLYYKSINKITFKIYSFIFKFI